MVWHQPLRRGRISLNAQGHLVQYPDNHIRAEPDPQHAGPVIGNGEIGGFGLPVEAQKIASRAIELQGRNDGEKRGMK
jgi:hypothetical protein